jgi:hypothetical protein
MPTRFQAVFPDLTNKKILEGVEFLYLEIGIRFVGLLRYERRFGTGFSNRAA